MLQKYTHTRYITNLIYINSNNAGTVIPSSASTEYTVGEEQYKLYYVGGDLVIPNSAKSGIHTGTFDVTITWQ